jgi:hypothetical protein
MIKNNKDVKINKSSKSPISKTVETGRRRTKKIDLLKIISLTRHKSIYKSN